MSRRRLWWLIGGAVAAFAVLAGVAVYFMVRANRASQPPAPRLRVEARFQAIRESPGHLTHVHDQHIACADCHTIAQASEFDAPGAELCARCHQQRATVHDTLLARAATDCLSCHTFGADRNIRPKKCARCHASGQGFVGAIVQHGKEDCTACHRPHDEPSLVPRPCTECHDEIHARHAPEVKGALLCLDCHRSHDTSMEADARCATCHSRPSGARVSARATFAGHRKCVSCHVPHDFSRTGVADCRSCHDQPVLAAVTAPAHRDCATCHEPHDVRSAKTRQRCAGCHDRITSGHPPASKAASAGGCLDCHPAHPESAPDQRVVACTSCHVRDRVRDSSMLAAHAVGDTSFHAGGVACAECHQPHGFAIRDQALCAECHATQAQSVRLVARKGHRDCMGCHRTAAHTPVAPPAACDTCHQEQRATAPAGHARCADCHRSHSGARLAKATCASCHQPQAQTRHAHVRRGCQACHRAHGPSGRATPPGCTTCHKVRILPSLHQIAEHQRCTDCHSAHESAPRGDRASCARCHEALETHEPDADQCTGCHLFR